MVKKLSELMKEDGFKETLQYVREFTINALTPEFRNEFPRDASDFDILVQWKSPGRWAVLHRDAAYDKNGNCEGEGLPSGRSDDFKKNYRHSLEDAILLAEKVAPTLKLMGYSGAEWEARVRKGHKEWEEQLRREKEEQNKLNKGHNA